MNIKIVAVGKLKEKYLKMGIEEFEKRLGAYAKVEIIELADEKTPESLSEAEEEQVKNKEGLRILGRISDNEYVMALAIEGKQYSSVQFGDKLDKLATYGHSRLTFIIGGSLGLSEAVYHRANELLSFSKMTFPHQMMRLFLLEQIYRGFRIVNGEPYHK